MTAVGAVLGATLVGGMSASAYQPTAQTLYPAQSASNCNKYPCVLYPKSAQLPSGRLVAGFEDSQGAVVGQKLPLFKSDDYGTSWQKLTDIAPPASLSSDPKYAPYTSNWTNPFFYVLPQDLGNLKAGTLLLADVVSGDDIAPNPSGNGNRQNIAIALYSSTDQGQTWSMVDIVATGPNQAQDPVWEPYLMMYQGKLVVYYSDENDYLGYDPTTGVPILDPANATAPDSGGQILAHKTWDGVGAWSSPVVDVSGITTNMGNGKTEIGGGRPGMTNIVPTTDGKWLLTYEYWAGGNNVRYKIADDPLKFFADGDPAGKQINSLPVTSSKTLALGGSPVLIRLPDGRLVYNAAGSGDVWVNASGSSTGAWKEYQTPLPSGYSRNLQYVQGTGRLEILQASWGSNAVGPVRFGDVDLGHSDGAYYSIVNRQTGQVLSAAADKTQDANLTGDIPDIISWADNPANDTQRWHLTHRAGSVTLLNKAGGRSVGIWQGSAVAGSKLTQWVDDGGTDKNWTLVASSDGYVKLQSVKNPQMYVTGATAGSNVTVQSAISTTGNPSADYAQQWKLVQQAPQPADLTSARQLSSLISTDTVTPGSTVALNAAVAGTANAASHANVSGHAYAVAASGTVTDLGTVPFDANETGSVVVPASLGTGSFQIAVAFDDTPLIWDTVTIADKVAQTISFDPIADATVGDADFTINPASSAGLPVTITSTGPCSVSGNTVHVTGVGTCTVTASQDGDASHTAADPVTQEFAVGKAVPTVNAPAVSAAWGTSAKVTVTVSSAAAEASGTVAVTEGSTSRGTATLANGQATFDLPVGLAGGQHSLTVSYQGNENLTAATADTTVTVTLPTAWDPAATYGAGNTVSYNGQVYTALWYSKGEVPGSSNTGAWQQIAIAEDGGTVWTASRVFNAGDKVNYQGKTFLATWYTRNEAPGSATGPWQEIASTSDGVAVWTPSRIFNTGDVVVYNGQKYTARWYSRNQVPTTPNGAWAAVN
ncbi:carbohydrate-binding protein [Leifsonia poae]|uniref:carbohydrate-binding protein n=1 Tax=Leifsonia poae TaxID=110933 RepID=UPI001CBBC34E|nr:carbohydrate-binding protein [Leifsonia poae]